MQKFFYDQFSLRLFHPGLDGEPLYEALKDPKVVRHMATSQITKEDCDYIIKDSLEHWKIHQIGSWAVEQNGCLVGWAGFKEWRDGELEILVVLSPSAWGLGKRVYHELITLAQDYFHLNSVYILLPSSRNTYTYVVKKLGFLFVEEAVFHGSTFFKFVLPFSKS